jgi:hypothetical protein
MSNTHRNNANKHLKAFINENNQNSDNEKFLFPNGFKGEGGNQRNFKLPKRTSGITPENRITSNNDKYMPNKVHF